MNESIISNLGSLASIIGLVFVLFNKGSTQTIKLLITIVVIMSCWTSYLIAKNSKYESAQYQQIANSLKDGMKRREASRDAQRLLSTFPTYISDLDPGDSQGIVYSTLRLLEAHKSQFPELYSRFKENILADIEEANHQRDSSQYKKIMANGAKASIRIVSGMAGSYKN